MNLEALIAQFRTDTDDKKPTYLSSDEDVTIWLNEAEAEAAIRASLLHEADDPEICEIAVTAGTSTYPLNGSVIDITKASFTPDGTTNEIDLEITDRVELDRVRPGWRRCSEEPRSIIQNDTTVQLGCLPSTDGLIRIECYRLPVNPLADDNDEPEIGRAHHRHLVHWARHRCYSRPDAELHNPGAAKTALEAFESHFGLAVDAGMRRSFQANRPLYNKAIW